MVSLHPLYSTLMWLALCFLVGYSDHHLTELRLFVAGDSILGEVQACKHFGHRVLCACRVFQCRVLIQTFGENMREMNGLRAEIYLLTGAVLSYCQFH